MTFPTTTTESEPDPQINPRSVHGIPRVKYVYINLTADPKIKPMQLEVTFPGHKSAGSNTISIPSTAS